jgi:hypothetical protein
MMTNRIKEKLLLQYYKKFEYLATNYSFRVFNFERHGYERDDIIQELRIKIYNCTKTYLDKWQEYRQTGRYKPIPIEYYIKCAMGNRVKDFIKIFNNEAVENTDKVSIHDELYDEGVHSTMESQFNLHRCICTINGVDFFDNLNAKQKTCFSYYLQGVPVSQLRKMPALKDVHLSFVNRQLDKIRRRKVELLDYSKTSYKHLSYAE